MKYKVWNVKAKNRQDKRNAWLIGSIMVFWIVLLALDRLAAHLT